MSEYLDASQYGGPVGGSKALYTATFNKQFRDAGVSVYLNYSNQSYWDRPVSERWNLSLARYFSVGTIKNMSLSMNLFRNQERDQRSGAQSSTGMYVSLSLPLGRSGTLSTNASRTLDKNSYSARFSDRLDERNSYQLSASDNAVSGYLSHVGDRVNLDLSASAQENDYTSLSVSARGGGTLTTKGSFASGRHDGRYAFDGRHRRCARHTDPRIWCSEPQQRVWQNRYCRHQQLPPHGGKCRSGKPASQCRGNSISDPTDVDWKGLLATAHWM